MSPDDRPQLSRLLILRPHPWAYHPDPPAGADLPLRESGRRPSARRPDAGDPSVPARGWREYLAGRFSALERQIQRLGHTPRDWIF